MLLHDDGFLFALGIAGAFLGFALAIHYSEDVILWVHIRDPETRENLKAVMRRNRRRSWRCRNQSKRA